MFFWFLVFVFILCNKQIQCHFNVFKLHKLFSLSLFPLFPKLFPHIFFRFRSYRFATDAAHQGFILRTVFQILVYRLNHLRWYTHRYAIVRNIPVNQAVCSNNYIGTYSDIIENPCSRTNKNIIADFNASNFFRVFDFSPLFSRNSSTLFSML